MSIESTPLLRRVSEIDRKYSKIRRKLRAVVGINSGEDQMYQADLNAIMEIFDSRGQDFFKNLQFLTPEQRSELLASLHRLEMLKGTTFNKEFNTFCCRLQYACILTPYSDAFLTNKGNQLKKRSASEGIERENYSNFHLSPIGLAEDYIRQPAAPDIPEISKLRWNFKIKSDLLAPGPSDKNKTMPEFLKFNSPQRDFNKNDLAINDYRVEDEFRPYYNLLVKLPDSDLSFIGIIQRMANVKEERIWRGLRFLETRRPSPLDNHRFEYDGIQEQYGLFMGGKGVVYLLKSSLPSHVVSESILKAVAQGYSPLVNDSKTS